MFFLLESPKFSRWMMTVTETVLLMFLANKIDKEKCAHRLRVLTGMSAHETDSLIIKLEERHIFVLK